MGFAPGISKPLALDSLRFSAQNAVIAARVQHIEDTAKNIADDWMSNIDKVMLAEENFNNPARFAMFLVTIFGTKGEAQQAAIAKLREELRDSLMDEATKEAMWRLGVE